MGSGQSTAVRLAAQYAAKHNEEEATASMATGPPSKAGFTRIYTGKGVRKPSTYQLSRWEKLYGKLFDEALKGGENAPIRLVDAHWFVDLMSQGSATKITFRQAMPAEAFLSLDELKMCGVQNGALPVVCVSYPWLHPHHPDPLGFHASNLARALKALISEPASASATLVGPGGTQRYGVFLDFCSLFQHPSPASGGFRSKEQDEAFKRGLTALGALYSALGTSVVRLTALPVAYPEGYDLPEGCNVALYNDRGWCFTESRWATLTKPATSSLDLGPISSGTGGAGSDAATPITREQLIDACARGGSRPPPLLPSQFEESLATKSFTNGKSDQPLVCALYAQAFHNTFRHVFVLHYEKLGWGDDEVLQLARVLEAVVEPAKKATPQADDALAIGRSARAAQLNELYLMGNSFGDAAAVELLRVAATLRGLSWLNLSENSGLGDATFSQLTALLKASKTNFKRLKEVRLSGTGASGTAVEALRKACADRKITLRTETPEEQAVSC